MKIKKNRGETVCKLSLDKEKPLGNPNGIRAGIMVTLLGSTAIELQVAPYWISTGQYSLITYPLLLNIIPALYPIGKWIKQHVMLRRVYGKLERIIHSEQLVDYETDKQKSILGQRKVIAGVKIDYRETTYGTYITFYPRGIKHSDAVRNLSKRLEENFGIPVIAVDNQATYTRYYLRDLSGQKLEVINNDF